MDSGPISITQADIQSDNFSDVTIFTKTKVVFQNPWSFKLARKKQRNNDLDLRSIYLKYHIHLNHQNEVQRSLDPYDDFSPRKLGQRHYLKELCPKNAYEVLVDHHIIQWCSLHLHINYLCFFEISAISAPDKAGIVSFTKYIIPLCSVNTNSCMLISRLVCCCFSWVRLSIHQPHFLGQTILTTTLFPLVFVDVTKK